MSEKYNKRNRDENGYTPNGKNKYGKISTLYVFKRHTKRGKSNIDGLKYQMKSVIRYLTYLKDDVPLCTKLNATPYYNKNDFRDFNFSKNRFQEYGVNFSRRRVQDYVYRFISKQNRIFQEENRLMCQD